MQTINFPEYAKVLPLKNTNEINLKDTIPNKIYKVDGGRIDVENNNYYWYETTNFAPSTKTEFLNQIKLNKMENKQTPVEFLIENLKMILPISQFNDVVMQDVFKAAKQNEKESIKSLNNRWAKSREEAKNTGIQIGIRLGVENSEEFWNKWDELIQGNDSPDENQIMNECIDAIFNIKQ